MVKAQKDIAWRIYLIYIFFCILGIAIISKVVYIQWFIGDDLRAKAERMTIDNKTIKAVRGNIYASDGSLLATSIPKYEIRFFFKIFSRSHRGTTRPSLARTSRRRAPADCSRSVVF